MNEDVKPQPPPWDEPWDFADPPLAVQVTAFVWQAAGTVLLTKVLAERMHQQSYDWAGLFFAIAIFLVARGLIRWHDQSRRFVAGLTAMATFFLATMYAVIGIQAGVRFLQGREGRGDILPAPLQLVGIAAALGCCFFQFRAVTRPHVVAKYKAAYRRRVRRRPVTKQQPRFRFSLRQMFATSSLCAVALVTYMATPRVIQASYTLMQPGPSRPLPISVSYRYRQWPLMQREKMDYVIIHKKSEEDALPPSIPDRERVLEAYPNEIEPWERLIQVEDAQLHLSSEAITFEELQRFRDSGQNPDLDLLLQFVRQLRAAPSDETDRR